jgi:predicted nucleic acid-binding protein
MGEFVLDTSVAMAWCFEDEANLYADAVLDSLIDNAALAPSIWPLEVGNVLLVAERRKRMSQSESKRFLELLSSLPIKIEGFSEQRMFEAVLNLARKQRLSSYDASYLDLAMQTELKLATLDQSLRKAAGRCGVAIYIEEKI